jgi:prolipoprotein diacylglyceryltransferase
MKASRLEALIWVLVYGGLIGVGLGLSVQRIDARLGYGLAIVGGVVAVVGLALIYVRSRMKELPQTKDKTS